MIKKLEELGPTLAHEIVPHMCIQQALSGTAKADLSMTAKYTQQ